jgi:mRNA interferase RelE/StbE
VRVGPVSWTVVLRPARPVATRILDALARLADTGQGDVTRLQGVADARRLRVGDWRVRFRYDHPTRTLEVLHLLPRGQAYRSEGA